MSEADVEKQGQNWKKLGCLGILGVLLFLAFLAAIAPEPTPEQIAEQEAQQAAEDAKRDEQRQAEAMAKLDQAMSVSSRDLASAYEANEVRAQEQFGGRDLLVTGSVTGVTLDFSDDPVVQLEGANQFLDVQADLNDKSAASQLDKGQQIKVLCSEVTEVVSAPMLSDCELIPE